MNCPKCNSIMQNDTCENPDCLSNKRGLTEGPTEVRDFARIISEAGNEEMVHLIYSLATRVSDLESRMEKAFGLIHEAAILSKQLTDNVAGLAEIIITLQEK